jgi:Uma2 family endonuclease
MGAAMRFEAVLQDDEPNRDEYYYGYRTIIEYDEKGRAVFRERPLTLDDFLEPEEGDVYMQGNLHEEDVDRLKSIFRFYLRQKKDITVYCDMKIVWGVEGLPNPAPDISIIRNVKDPKKPRGSFYVPEEGTKPFFILEVVSPRYREADADKKPDIYRKAGVSEYIIADPGLEGGTISYKVTGYRLIGGRYVGIKPDRDGRLRSMTTGVLIGTSGSGSRIAVYDAASGEEIMSDEERADQEKLRADQEKLRAEHEKLRADQEKLRADRLAAKLRELGISPETV